MFLRSVPPRGIARSGVFAALLVLRHAAAMMQMLVRVLKDRFSIKVAHRQFRIRRMFFLSQPRKILTIAHSLSRQSIGAVVMRRPAVKLLSCSIS